MHIVVCAVGTIFIEISPSSYGTIDSHLLVSCPHVGALILQRPFCKPLQARRTWLSTTMKAVYCVWILGIYTTLITAFLTYRQFLADSHMFRSVEDCPTTSPPTTAPPTTALTSSPEKEQKPVERKCISYCLYQQSEDPPSLTYTGGFLLNADLARILFPSWKIHLYLDDRLNGSDFYKTITSRYNDTVNIVWMNALASGHFGHTWRFLVADNEECDRWIVRDTDDRLSIRTLQAVLDWIWSGRSFHIMRDHPLHDGLILAGLFGGVKGCLGDGVKMEDLVVEYFSKPNKLPNDFWSDQRFLAEVVFPRIKSSFLVHDDFLDQHSTCKNYGNCKKFPVKDTPFVAKWSHHETMDCSCKPRCICKDGVCPIKALSNGDSSPVCL